MCIIAPIRLCPKVCLDRIPDIITRANGQAESGFPVTARHVGVKFPFSDEAGIYTNPVFKFRSVGADIVHVEVRSLDYVIIPKDFVS